MQLKREWLHEERRDSSGNHHFLWQKQKQIVKQKEKAVKEENLTFYW